MLEVEGMKMELSPGRLRNAAKVVLRLGRRALSSVCLALPVVALLFFGSGCSPSGSSNDIDVHSSDTDVVIAKYECVVDYDCEVNEYCGQGKCLAGPKPCSLNSECANGERCLGATCVPESFCSSDSDCPTHKECANSYCWPRKCNTESDCPGESVCTYGLCSAGLPACTADQDCPGNYACSGGTCQPPTCPDGEPAQSELCDDKDNDCDGKTDEDFPSKEQGCIIQRTETIQVAGTFVCSEDGTGTVCYNPKLAVADEICDYLDNNLNGLVDETFPVGISCLVKADDPCNPTGTYQCSADGSSVVCLPTEVKQSSDEVCDGIDNDCNGLIDEGFPVGEWCTAGIGPCAVNGDYVCSADMMDVVCKTEGGEGPEPEKCDGVDNDCDGEVDEGFGIIGGQDFGMIGNECVVYLESYPACTKMGHVVCSDDGQTAHCSHTPFPLGIGKDEICDGIDNDCDGTVDNGVAPPDNGICGSDVGECETGLWKCYGGKFLCMYAGWPTQEVCDLKDNDCDGEIDNSLACKQLGDDCETDVECTNGYCAWGAGCTVPCIDVGGCPVGFGCLQFSVLSSYCFPLCEKNADCEEGKICYETGLENGCIPKLSDAGYMEECTWNQGCASGECVYSLCSEECDTSADCPDGSSCLNLLMMKNYCFPTCEDEEDCSAGFQCLDTALDAGCVPQ